MKNRNVTLVLKHRLMNQPHIQLLHVSQVDLPPRLPCSSVYVPIYEYIQILYVNACSSVIQRVSDVLCSFGWSLFSVAQNSLGNDIILLTSDQQIDVDHSTNGR